MKLFSTVALLATLLTVPEVAADKPRKAKDVSLGINEDLCIFKNFDDQWCFSSTPPMIKAGWDVRQTFTTTPTTESPVIEYYQWELQPYMNIGANIISNLRLQNIWVNLLTFDLDSFRVHAYFSLIWNENFEVCPGLGWETERVLVKMLYSMKFWNCNKVLIDDLKDYSKTWTGFDAQYFENCEESNDVEVILYEKEMYKANEGKEWYGTVNAKSAKYCLPLLGSSSKQSLTGLQVNEDDPSVLVAKMAYKTFFNWVTYAYPEAFE